MFVNGHSLILNIESDKLTLVSIEKKGARLSGVVTKEYAGFQDGKFIDLEELYTSVKCLVDTLAYRFGIKSKKISVGVPGEFTLTKLTNADTNVQGIVKRSHIRQLVNAETFIVPPNFRKLSTEAVYFKTDASPYKFSEPEGEECRRLSASLTNILCERYFTDIFDDIAARLRLQFWYLSTADVCVKYLFNRYSITEHQEYVVILLGYMSTTVIRCAGDKTLSMCSFAMGTLNIAGSLTVELDIPFSHGNALTNKINFNIGAEDTYLVFNEGESFTYSVEKVNQIAGESLDSVGEYIARAMKSLNCAQSPVFLTGERFSSLHGVKERLSKKVGNMPILAEPSYLCLRSPEYFALVSMIKSIIR